MKYIESGGDYSELALLVAQDALVNLRKSSGQSVDVKTIANKAPDVDESRMKVVPDDADDWNFAGAIGLNEVERVGIK